MNSIFIFKLFIYSATPKVQKNVTKIKFKIEILRENVKIII